MEKINLVYFLKNGTFLVFWDGNLVFWSQKFESH
jgi:hypothetical protein